METAVLATMDETGVTVTEETWVGIGGVSYEVGWIIDLNDNFMATLEPDAGDISGQSIALNSFDGDQEIVLDLDVDPVQEVGTIIAELDFPEADGGEAVFFVTLPITDWETFDPTTQILASAVITVDQDGYANTVLYEGFSGSATIFYADDSTTYEFYSAIDMNGVLVSEERKYNDPFDYVDTAMGGDQYASSPYSFDGDEWVHYDSGNYNQMRGIIVDASSLIDYVDGGQDIIFNLLSDDGYGNVTLEGQQIIYGPTTVGELLTVIYKTTEEFTWEGDPGNYTLEVIIDSDVSGGLSAGELAAYYGVYYNDEPMEYAVPGDDFHIMVNGTTALYSEDSQYGSLIPLNIGDQNTSHNLDSTFTPYNGTYSMEVNFYEITDPEEAVWLHINTDYPMSIDTTSVNRIYFRINLSNAPTVASIDYLIGDGDGTHGGMNLISDTYLVSGPDIDGWSLYSLPLFPDPAVDGEFINAGEYDYDNITGFGLGFARDDSGDTINCTVYLDDIYMGYEAP